MTETRFSQQFLSINGLKGVTINFLLLFFLNLPRSEVEFSIDDFNTVGGKVPLIANVKPHGKVQCIPLF